MNLRAFELEMQRLTFTYAVWELIAFVAFMAVLYFVIKTAVREGIRESGLLDGRRAEPTMSRRDPKGP
jgi:hypothetical protein